MEQDREKLKVIDIEFKDNAAHDDTLFVDVTGYKFLDNFLIIESYKEYSDGTVRGLLTYIPKHNIAKMVVYQEKADYERYIDDLVEAATKKKIPAVDTIDVFLRWYDTSSGGIKERLIRSVVDISVEKEVGGNISIHFLAMPGASSTVTTFKVRNRDIITFDKLKNGEKVGSWYE